MKTLILTLAIATTACSTAAPDRAATPIDVNLTTAPRVAMAPPGTMEFVVHEAPAPAALEVSAPETSLRPGVCEKPRHLSAAP